jgi:hypothetical protein
MARHLPATSATASDANTTHTTATSPTTAIRHNAKPTDLTARVPSYRAARAAMPAHVRDDSVRCSHDAPKAHPGEPSAARASKNRQTENRGAGGEAGQAGVPPSSSNGMGRSHDVVLCASDGRHLAAAKLLARGRELRRSRCCRQKKPPKCLRAASSRSHHLCRCGTIGGQWHATRLPLQSPGRALAALLALARSRRAVAGGEE